MRVRIGDRGHAATALRPSGEILLGGCRWPARCEDGWMEPGTEVVVTAAEPFGLVVRPAGSVPPKGLSNAGAAVPSAQELSEHRGRREQQVRAEEAEAARAAALRDNWVFVIYLVLIAIPAVAAGAWLGGELGLTIALGVVIGVPLLLWAWATA